MPGLTEATPKEQAEEEARQERLRGALKLYYDYLGSLPVLGYKDPAREQLKEAVGSLVALAEKGENIPSREILQHMTSHDKTTNKNYLINETTPLLSHLELVSNEHPTSLGKKIGFGFLLALGVIFSLPFLLIPVIIYCHFLKKETGSYLPTHLFKTPEERLLSTVKSIQKEVDQEKKNTNRDAVRVRIAVDTDSDEDSSEKALRLEQKQKPQSQPARQTAGEPAEETKTKLQTLLDQHLTCVHGTSIQTQSWNISQQGEKVAPHIALITSTKNETALTELLKQSKVNAIKTIEKQGTLTVILSLQEAKSLLAALATQTPPQQRPPSPSSTPSQSPTPRSPSP